MVSCGQEFDTCPLSSTPGGSVELSLSSVGSHFPRSVSAGQRLFEVLELDGLRAVVAVRGGDDLVAPDEDLVHEVLEELVAGLGGVDRRLSEPLEERTDRDLVHERRGLDVLGLDRGVEFALLGPRGQIIGCARVSIVEQNEARQIEALGDVDRLFIDRACGGSRQHPELDAALAYLRDRDTLRVKSIDRLARSARDLLTIIDTLRANGVEVEFTDNPTLNTATPQGGFMLTILGAVAELELAIIRERQAEGIALAKARGVYSKGPKPAPEQVEEACRRVADRVPKTVVARDLGVSRQTLYTALAGEGQYAP